MPVRFDAFRSGRDAALFPRAKEDRGGLRRQARPDIKAGRDESDRKRGIGLAASGRVRQETSSQDERPGSEPAPLGGPVIRSLGGPRSAEGAALRPREGGARLSFNP